jgi:hypothetical protein
MIAVRGKRLNGMGGDVTQFRSYDSSRSTPSARSKRDRIAIHTFPFGSRTHIVVPPASYTHVHDTRHK